VARLPRQRHEGAPAAQADPEVAVSELRRMVLDFVAPQVRHGRRSRATHVAVQAPPGSTSAGKARSGDLCSPSFDGFSATADLLKVEGLEVNETLGVLICVRSCRARGCDRHSRSLLGTGNTEVGPGWSLKPFGERLDPSLATSGRRVATALLSYRAYEPVLVTDGSKQDAVAGGVGRTTWAVGRICVTSIYG
jgi:hypothetical protein